MTHIVWPTVNAVGGSSGQIASEANLTDYANQITFRDSIIAGCTMPATKNSLTINLSSGKTLVDGYITRFTTGPGVPLTANVTNYLYYKLTKTGNTVSASSFKVTTSSTIPANSIYIGKAITNTTSVTATSHANRVSSIFDATGGHTHDGVDGEGPRLHSEAVPYNVPWRKAGTTVLTSATSETVAPSNYRYFRLPSYGKFRVSGDIKRASSGATSATVELYFGEMRGVTPSVTKTTAGTFTTSSTSYVAFSVDMVKPTGYGASLIVYSYRGGSGNMAVRNINIKAAESTEIPSTII